MPGQLKEDAVCPICRDPLIALADLTTARVVQREYYHGRRPGMMRRKPPCTEEFADYDVALVARRALEVHRF
jgi:hypothetical protein